MRFTLPTRRPAPTASPVPPGPRQPPPELDLDLEDAPPPGDRAWLSRIKLSRIKLRTALVAAGVTVVALCFGLGVGTDLDRLKMGSGSAGVPREAENANADKAAAARAAEDRATARKVAAAQAADARAAAERAAEAKAAQLAAARRQVVAMPTLVGRRLDTAMELAADTGLTAVAVCRTPDGDRPLWWSNWRVTGQDVPAGTRVRADRPVCVSATK